ncbi:MAG: triple tyrosine motif-containing protein [Pseudomonadota bacterium]
MLAFDVSSRSLRYFPTDLENYLSPSLVEALAFDTDGAVWVATLRGVHRITEQSLFEASIEPTTRVTAGSSVAQIIPIGRAVFLVTMRGDLFKLTDGEIQLVSKSPTIVAPARPPFRIRERNVGVLTEHGIHSTDFEEASRGFGGKPKTTLYQGNFSSNAVFVDEFGICAATYSSLICGIDSLPGQQFELFASEDNSDIVHIEYSRNSKRVIALTDGNTLIDFHVGHGTTQARIRVHEVKNKQVRAFALWKQYALVGTDEGVLAVDLESSSKAWVNLDTDLRTVGFVEDHNGVWVLHESGVSFVAESNVRNWPNQHGALDLEVLSIGGVGERAVAGTFNGLYFVDFASEIPEKAWPVSQLLSELDLRITAMAFDGLRLFAGTFSGALHTLSVENSQFRYSGSSSLPSGISALYHDRQKLLIGTSQNGLFVLQNENLEPLEMPASWKRNPTPITSITASGHEDSVIVTSENEVIEICKGESLQVCGVQTLEASLAGSTLLDATNLGNGTILIGSVSGGVLQSSVSKIRKGNVLDEASIKIDPGSPVFSLDSTDSGLIVIGTDEGILIVDQNFVSVGQYHRFHGLRNYNVNHGATHLLDGDTISVGGRFGVSSLELGDLEVKDKGSRMIHLTAVTFPGAGRVNADITNSATHISLKYPESRLVLEFSLGDYRKVLQNRYSYSLLGLDETTHDKYGRGIAEYRQLPPGEYTFQARGADAQGIWSENQLSIPIIVNPPWWRGALAFWVYSLLALLTIGLGYRFYTHHRQREQQLALANEQARALARLEDDWQEERGAAERVLERVTPDIVGLLETTHLLFAAHLNARDGNTASDDVDAIQGKLLALQKQQELCTRTTLGDKSNLHQLVEELVAAISSNSARANRYILLNDTPSVDVPSHHAQYLSLVVHEVVCVLIDAPEVTSDPNPVVQVAIAVSDVESETGGARYSVLANERLKRPISELELEAGLPVTFQLVEDLGGDIQQLDSLGLEIEVSLPLEQGTDTTYSRRP